MHSAFGLAGRCSSKTTRVNDREGHGFSFEPALSERREPKGSKTTSRKWRFSA
jgi:hypothetical protein